jgi:hypothetical protein
MKAMLLPALGIATVLGVTMAASGQTTGQTPGSATEPQPRTQTTPAPAQTRPAGGQTVTIVGCIQSEAEYRKAHNLGRGGAVGTGVGAGNEFVLANASMAPASSGGAAGVTPPAGGTSPRGTATGTTGAAEAYELTGANEGKASQFVGKRVEIAGMLKPAETAGAAPTGGPTAGAPPRGVDVASDDLKLRELEVTSVREATGTCTQ